MTNLMVFSGFIVTWVIQLVFTVAILSKIEDSKWDNNKGGRR